MRQEQKTEVKKRKKRKNGIWFSDSTTIDNFAQEKAEKLQHTLENIIFYGITIPIQLIQTAGVVIIAIFNNWLFFYKIIFRRNISFKFYYYVHNFYLDNIFHYYCTCTQYLC